MRVEIVLLGASPSGSTAGPSPPQTGAADRLPHSSSFLRWRRAVRCTASRSSTRCGLNSR